MSSFDYLKCLFQCHRTLLIPWLTFKERVVYYVVNITIYVKRFLWWHLLLGIWPLNLLNLCLQPSSISGVSSVIICIFTCFHRIQQQQEVLAWLLEPLNKMWTQVEWRTAYLSDPTGLTNMFADSQFMWSIYHTVTFFEKALKRSGIKKSTTTPQAPTTTAAPGYLHPISSHLAWILPPLLRVCLAVWLSVEIIMRITRTEIMWYYSILLSSFCSYLLRTGYADK